MPFGDVRVESAGLFEFLPGEFERVGQLCPAVTKIRLGEAGMIGGLDRPRVPLQIPMEVVHPGNEIPFQPHSPLQK